MEIVYAERKKELARINSPENSKKCYKVNLIMLGFVIFQSLNNEIRFLMAFDFLKMDLMPNVG